MASVWLVSTGLHDYYETIGAFTTEERAKEMAGIVGGDVQRWELDSLRADHYGPEYYVCVQFWESNLRVLRSAASCFRDPNVCRVFMNENVIRCVSPTSFDEANALVLEKITEWFAKRPPETLIDLKALFKKAWHRAAQAKDLILLTPLAKLPLHDPRIQQTPEIAPEAKPPRFQNPILTARDRDRRH